MNKKWWTEVFYDEAYDYIERSGIEKFPIVIPSYNRPNFNFYKYINTMTEDYNYPVYVFVRESQYQDYIRDKKSKYVTIIPIQDEMINSAGKVRRESMRWLYSHGYEFAFSIDDDLNDITYSDRGVTKKGDPKSVAVGNVNLAKVLAMWQLSMMKADEEYGISISGVSPRGFCWRAEYSDYQESLLMRGTPNQAVCLNVKRLLDDDINYKDNEESGHEDLDILIEAVDKRHNIGVFPFLTYSAPAMSVENFGRFGSTMQDRFRTQQAIMKTNHEDKEWVTFRDKRDLAQVVLNCVRIRKVFDITKYKFDIWNNGEIIGL